MNAVATSGIDEQHLLSWVGRQESVEDMISATPVAALSATLDRLDPRPSLGDPLPTLWHWLYFLPMHPQSEIGPDGHAKRGGFLPPVELPRRMWAGGRFTFGSPLRIGEVIRRTSTITDLKVKDGRSGSLVFVTVRHEVIGSFGGSLTEEHDIVYRDVPRETQSNTTPPRPPVDPVWSRKVVPDDVLLFRYSALTFNGHRIHYDRRYVTTVEGYPGLIVHGPLIATLLVDLARRQDPRPLRSFQFRAVSPVFDITPFSVCGRPDADGKAAALWAETGDGALAMEARATFA
jgi:3-methylfumaryl-CoA hydratase